MKLKKPYKELPKKIANTLLNLLFREMSGEICRIERINQLLERGRKLLIEREEVTEEPKRFTTEWDIKHKLCKRRK